MIEPKYIDMIIDQVDLEKVVSGYVGDMKRKGHRLWACCPFHQEATPSFCVDKERKLWHCYGSCQDGGTVIKFIQKVEHLPFSLAVKKLLKDELHIDLQDVDIQSSLPFQKYADISMASKKELQEWFSRVFDTNASLVERQKFIDNVCDQIAKVDSEDIQEELISLFARCEGTKQLWRSAFNTAKKRLSEDPGSMRKEHRL